MLRVAGMRIHREALVCVLTALLPRHTLPWLPAARADPSSCAAPQGAAGSHLLSEKEELKTQTPGAVPRRLGWLGALGSVLPPCLVLSSVDTLSAHPSRAALSGSRG